MTKKISIFNKKGLKLSAVLGVPEGNQKYPTVILLHGFTGYKDEEHIVSIGEYLTNNGYVTIRFDCSGFGESEGKTWDEYRVSNYVSDIESVYQFLLKQKFVDKNKIGVWGQSMGGMLAIIFASMHPEIKTVCAVSVPTQFARKDNFERRTKGWKKIGYFEKESSKYGHIKIPYNFVEDAQKWNALESVKLVTQPLLIVLGTADTNVYPENTREIFKEVNQPKELVEIEGMAHNYKNHPEQIEKVNKIVGDFFKKNLAQTS